MRIMIVAYLMTFLVCSVLIYGMIKVVVITNRSVIKKV